MQKTQTKSISQLGGRTIAASTGTTAVQLLRSRERTLAPLIKTVLADHESFVAELRVMLVLDDNLLGMIAPKDPGLPHRGRALGRRADCTAVPDDDDPVDGAKLMQSGDGKRSTPSGL